MLAQRVNLAGLIDERFHLAKHGTNNGCKALTVIGTMLAGGDSIDDTAVLRAGAAGELFDATRAPSTIGTWLRAHKWSNVRQHEAISRELLARMWARKAARRTVAHSQGPYRWVVPPTAAGEPRARLARDSPGEVSRWS